MFLYGSDPHLPAPLTPRMGQEWEVLQEARGLLTRAAWQDGARPAAEKAAERASRSHAPVLASARADA